jgi:hypothetical protein
MAGCHTADSSAQEQHAARLLDAPWRRYHEESRASAKLDPVFRKMWQDGGNDVLPRAEAWVREMAPAIAARLSQPGFLGHIGGSGAASTHSHAAPWRDLLVTSVSQNRGIASRWW